MAAVTKLTAVILLVCLAAYVAAQGPPQGGQKDQGGRQQGRPVSNIGGPGNQQPGGPGGEQRGHRALKRSIDHQDGDNADALIEPPVQSNFERPGRIRFLPAFLH